MDQVQPPKKIRKGAKSCTECRRRKIRCVWLSNESQVCRRCEERGSACVPQLFSSQAVREQGVSSRERISRLEQQVRSLTQVVNTVQERLGGPLVIDNIFKASASDDGLSDEESDDLDAIEAHPPTYLTNLFNNDVISSGDQAVESPRRKESFLKVLENKARENLQKLIPPRKDVETIAGFALTWLTLYHALFPTNAVAQSNEDILARYSAMQNADVDPTSLATWLVTITITIQQIPEEDLGTLSGIKNPSHYSRAVSEAVENNILAHDSLMGTMGGIATALHFIRLQAGRENFKKIWLTLRRVIAIAELIGLPRTARISERSQFSLTDNYNEQDGLDSRRSKAETWISICTLDRILGMMCNLPTGTTKYSLPRIDMTMDEPQIFFRNYLRNLADIATKIQELDDIRISGGSDEQIYAEVLKVDRDLISLGSKAPKSWWDEREATELVAHLLPYWHYYVTLRTHLVLTLQRDDNHRYDYSRYTCMNACQHALQRFLKMRPMLTGGFFLGRMLDLQALTAAAILLLSYHGTKSDAGLQFQAQTIGEPGNLIMQVVAVMEQGGRKKSSDFAKHAAPTIRSLKMLLEDDQRLQVKDLTLKVPLLGKIHVRKRVDAMASTSEMQTAQLNSHTVTPSLQSFQGTSSPATTQQLSSGDALGELAFDPFTWFIEDDRESVFKDALLAEDFNHFESPINYDNFQFTI